MLPRLMKDLAKFFAILLLLLPVNSFSLGLGEINLHSALNQPLDAEVGLLSVGNTDAEDIAVKLGTKDDFDKAGIDRPHFLTRFKFKVAKRANGEPYLKITSHDPVKEPFLDFIIEANWPSGRVLREYTLLLDPPVLVDERPAALDIPLFEEALPAEDGSAQLAPAATATSDATPRREIPRFTPRVSSVSRSESGEVAYGPVKRSDTLWSIASQMRPDNSLTVQQVMIALLKENPEAFDNQNINDLKAGYFLRISDPAMISEVSSNEAERIAKLHYEQWVDAKQSMALAAGQRPLGVSGEAAASAGAGEVESRLKLMAPDEGLSQAGSGSTLGASGGDIRQELAFALESADISRQENEELRKRLSVLEEQLASMQRLITLKDDTLSAMQVTPEELAAAEATLKDSAILPADAELALGTDQEQSDAVMVSGDGQQPETAAGTTSTTPPPVVAAPPPPAVESSVVDDILAAVDGVLGGALDGVDPMIAGGGLAVVLLLVAMVVARKRKMAAAMEDSGDYGIADDVSEATADTEAVSDEAVESVLNDVIPDYSSSSGMDVNDDDEIDAIAEADVYLAYRRFDKAEELLNEAIQNEPDRHDIQLKLLEVYAASDKKDAFVERAESLRASLGGTDSSTWKSVVAMGSKIAPTNVLFNEEADAVDSTGASDELDIDLPDLGGDLDLGELDMSVEESTTTPVEPESTSENPFSDVSSESDEFDFPTDSGAGSDAAPGDAFESLDDLGELEASLDSAMDMVSEGESDSLPDLDMDLGEPEAGKSKDGVTEASDDLSFTGELELDTVGETEEGDLLGLSSEGDVPSVSAESDELAFDVDFATEESGDELNLMAEVAAEGDDSAPDSSSESMEEVVEAVSPVEQAAESLESDDISSDIEDDLFAGLDEDIEGSASASSSEDDWLSDISDDISSLDEDIGDLDDSELFSAEDEVGTKLDLARAYIDMGDNESAKGILDEVVTDGNDGQKKDASELIERIS